MQYLVALAFVLCAGCRHVTTFLAAAPVTARWTPRSPAEDETCMQCWDPRTNGARVFSCHPDAARQMQPAGNLPKRCCGQ